MLTLKQIYDNKEQIIAGLEKKHFANAAETIEQVIRLDTEGKAAQQQQHNAAAGDRVGRQPRIRILLNG